MDLVLLNALTEEAMKGNRHDDSWTTETYTNIVNQLSSTIGPHITKQHVKNRLKTLKENFAEAYDLFNSLSGFAWNPLTKKFEAEEEVWDDFIKDKPLAKKWKTMQIKHYDTLKELFGADRATGKAAATTRERGQQIEREPIDLNDLFDNTEMPNVDMMTGNDTPFSAANADPFSPLYGQSNQSGGTSTSAGKKRKAHMFELMEAQYEKISFGIDALTNAINSSNNVSVKLHEVAERQVQVAERQVDVAERHVEVAKMQAETAKRQVIVAEKQVEIAKEGLTIMQQSKPRHYTESDIWDMLTALGVLDPYRMKCYQFLCENDKKKLQIFGMPSENRLQALFHMMADAGIQ